MLCAVGNEMNSYQRTSADALKSGASSERGLDDIQLSSDKMVLATVAPEVHVHQDMLKMNRYQVCPCPLPLSCLLYHNLLRSP
jgi:hypothetical protein